MSKLQESQHWTELQALGPPLFPVTPWQELPPRGVGAHRVAGEARVTCSQHRHLPQPAPLGPAWPLPA